MAEELLEELATQGYYPGVIGSLVALYLKDGKMSKAYDLLYKAVNFYKKSGVSLRSHDANSNCRKTRVR